MGSLDRAAWEEDHPFPTSPKEKAWQERFGPGGWDGVSDYVIAPKLILTEGELKELDVLLEVRPSHYYNDCTRSLRSKVTGLLLALTKVREIEDKKSCA